MGPCRPCRGTPAPERIRKWGIGVSASAVAPRLNQIVVKLRLDNLNRPPDVLLETVLVAPMSV